MDHHFFRLFSLRRLSLNAYCFLLSRQHPNILINTCCPGWVKSDVSLFPVFTSFPSRWGREKS